MTVTINGTTGITSPGLDNTANTTLGDASGDSVTINAGTTTFAATGARITGDFSNTTISNRVAFQSSTTNAQTILALIPNGTNQVSGISAVDSSSDPDNSSECSLAVVGGVDVRFNSSRRGTGTYLPMTFLTGGSERMRIDTSGNVGIATTTTTRARLNIDTDGSNNASGYGIALTNTAGGGATWTLQCGDQGVNNAAFTIRQTGISGTTRLKLGTDGYLTVPGVYALTTGSSANVFVDSNGILQRSTSSLKYKKDVQDATHGLVDVLKLRSVTYGGKSEADEGKTFGGFIAEEVHEAGLTEFVQYANDGSPDALAYGNMVSLCVKAIQELKAELDTVKAELATLKGQA